jgi:hypothetical protein
MRGSDYRLLLACHSEIIGKSITNTTRRYYVQCALDRLLQIQWIAYAEPWVRDNRVGILLV